MAGVELALPVDFAGIQIERIKPIMQRYFVGKLAVAGLEALQQFLPFQALFLEFGNVVVGIINTGLRLLGLTVGGDGGEEDAFAADDRRRPAEAREVRGPFNVFRLRPLFGEIGVGDSRVGRGPAEGGPFGIGGESDGDREDGGENPCLGIGLSPP
jgi:hypothetical protein